MDLGVLFEDSSTYNITVQMPLYTKLIQFY